MTPRLALLALFGTLALTGCDKDTEVTDDTQDSSTAAPTWSEMSGAEKSAYMATDVSPQMAAIFQAYDAEAYADFSCDTCHTDGGTDFSMPSEDLAGYWEEGAFPGPDTTDPGALFMHEEVLPLMTELLDAESLPCLTCHVE